MLLIAFKTISIIIVLCGGQVKIDTYYFLILKALNFLNNYKKVPNTSISSDGLSLDQAPITYMNCTAN